MRRPCRSKQIGETTPNLLIKNDAKSSQKRNQLLTKGYITSNSVVFFQQDKQILWLDYHFSPFPSKQINQNSLLLFIQPKIIPMNVNATFFFRESSPAALWTAFLVRTKPILTVLLSLLRWDFSKKIFPKSPPDVLVLPITTGQKTATDPPLSSIVVLQSLPLFPIVQLRQWLLYCQFF